MSAIENTTTQQRCAHVARRRVRRSAVSLVAVATVTLLTGCVKFDVDAAVDKTAKFSGTLTYAVDEKVMASLQQLDTSATPAEKKQTPDQQVTAGLAEARKLKGVTRAVKYKQGGRIGATITFKNWTAKDLLSTLTNITDSSTDTLTVTRSGTVIELHGKIFSANNGKPNSPLSDSIAASKPDLRIRFTFPGKVLETNGTVSGKSVTWVPEINKVTSLDAKASLA